MRRVAVVLLALCVGVGMMLASQVVAKDTDRDECEHVFRDILKDFGTMLENEELSGDILDLLIAGQSGDLDAISTNLGNAISVSRSLVDKLLDASPECMRSALNVTTILSKAVFIDQLIRDQVERARTGLNEFSFATLRNLLGRAIETKKDALMQTFTEFQKKSGLLPF